MLESEVTHHLKLHIAKDPNESRLAAPSSLRVAITAELLRDRHYSAELKMSSVVSEKCQTIDKALKISNLVALLVQRIQD